MKLENGTRVLFLGDSITDAARDRADFHGMAGYPQMVDNYIKTFFAEKNIECINRGISGDTTEMLLMRMERDCFELSPDAVSILIGINDVWRRYDSNKLTTVEAFRSNYRSILEGVRRRLRCKIMVLEPFLLASDKSRDGYREDLDPKIAVVRELAREFADEYVPLDGIFAEASVKNTPQYYSIDAVHPTRQGEALIAKEWLKRVKL